MENFREEKNPQYYTMGSYMNIRSIDSGYRLAKKVLKFLPSPKRCGSILEIGCGGGFLADILLKAGYTYTGLDSSPQSIALCKIRTKNDCFLHKNVLHPGVWSIFKQYQVFILMEVLEHLEEDLLILSKFPPSSTVIFSVPSYDSVPHVRYFPTRMQVLNRYSKEIRITDMKVYLLYLSENKIYICKGVKK